MTGDLLKEVHSYETFYERIRKMWSFNAGDCLIEVTACAGLTVCLYITDRVLFNL